MKKIAIVILSFYHHPVRPAQVNNSGSALPRPADVLQLKENSHNFGKIPRAVRPYLYL
jgi:hypothetical protein